MSRSKQVSLIWLTIASLLIVVLAMSLPGLALRPGQPFSLGPTQTTASGNNNLLSDPRAILIFQGILALALICLPVYIIFSLLTPEGRQRLVADVIVLTLFFLLAEYLHSLPRNPDAVQLSFAAGASSNLNPLQNSEPTAIFSATPPDWLIVIVSLIVSIALVAVVFGLSRFVQQRRSRTRALSRLADEAHTAIASLQHGGDFTHTIIHCYQEMVRVIEAEQGIVRETAMTPREFEDQLVTRGLPYSPVNTLTRLFEQARYGRLAAEPAEEELALTCLTEIAEACRLLRAERAERVPRAAPAPREIRGPRETRGSHEA